MNKLDTIHNLRKIKLPFEKMLSFYGVEDYCEALDIAIDCVLESFLLEDTAKKGDKK